MKKLLGIMTMALTLTACELETSANGDLDGFWLITSIDTLATHGHKELRDSSLTWSFQGRILEIRRAIHQTDEIFICKFEHEGGVVHVFDIYRIKREQEDPKIEDPAPLRSFGINQLDEHFLVATLNADHMVLQSNGLQINFEKY